MSDRPAGVPDGAVRVRADEVQPRDGDRPGDVVWVDGEELGEVIAVVPYRPESMVLQLNTQDRGWVVRCNRELVWVVRPEPTVTLTITMPAKDVRYRATWPAAPAASWAGELDRACREWVAAHPQDGNPQGGA